MRVTTFTRVRRARPELDPAEFLLVADLSTYAKQLCAEITALL